jgi:hypothetical protein
VATAAAITINSDAPTLGLQIKPSVASLALSGASPTVNGRVIVTPASAGGIALSSVGLVLDRGMSAATATVAYGASAPQLDLMLPTTTASMAIAGSVPFLSTTGVPQTQAGAIALSGLSPTLGLSIVPRAVALVAPGATPVVNSLTTLTTATGAVSYSSTGPTLANTAVPVPLTGSIQFGAAPPQIIRSGFAAPQIGGVSMVGNVPLAQQTTNGFIVPGAAAIDLSGQPAVVPLYQPDQYHTVQSPGPDRYTVHSPG